MLAQDVRLNARIVALHIPTKANQHYAVKHLVPPHHLLDGEGRQDHIGVAADNDISPGNSNARILCMPPAVMRLPYSPETHIQAQLLQQFPRAIGRTVINHHHFQPLLVFTIERALLDGDEALLQCIARVPGRDDDAGREGKFWTGIQSREVGIEDKLAARHLAVQRFEVAVVVIVLL